MILNGEIIFKLEITLIVRTMFKIGTNLRLSKRKIVSTKQEKKFNRFMLGLGHITKRVLRLMSKVMLSSVGVNVTTHGTPSQICKCKGSIHFIFSTERSKIKIDSMSEETTKIKRI
jgi:hypothetical protein